MIPLFFLIPFFAFAEDAPIPTVPYVDLQRYAGTWYEIARLTSPDEEKICQDKTFTYTLRSDGTIGFRNECRKEEGIEVSEGTARVIDPIGQAEWRFSFLPIPGSDRFFGADYRIVVLADDYSFAVITEPEESHLWILSRTPELSNSTYAGILEKIKHIAPKFDLGKLSRLEPSSKT